MPKNKTVFSQSISDFSNFIIFAKEQYLRNIGEVGRLDKLTQDYLHKLELEDVTYKERAKIATKLAECRRLRRQSKDTVEVLQPFMDYICSGSSFSDEEELHNQLSAVLGAVRSKEKYLEKRSYKFRILDCEDIGDVL